jgi:hypothetical protein
MRQILTFQGGQATPKLLYGPEDSLLGGIRRDAQRIADLFGRSAFHVPQNKGRLLCLRQRKHGVPLHGADLATEEKPVGACRFVRHLYLVLLGICFRSDPHSIIHPVDTAYLIQCAPHSYPVDPGAEIGPGFEGFELQIPTQERFLHHVVRIGFIAGYAEGDPEEALAVAPNKRPISVFVSRENRLDRRVVVLVHAQH